MVEQVLTWSVGLVSELWRDFPVLQQRASRCPRITCLPSPSLSLNPLHAPLPPPRPAPRVPLPPASCTPATLAARCSSSPPWPSSLALHSRVGYSHNNRYMLDLLLFIIMFIVFPRFLFAKKSINSKLLVFVLALARFFCHVFSSTGIFIALEHLHVQALFLFFEFYSKAVSEKECGRYFIYSGHFQTFQEIENFSLVFFSKKVKICGVFDRCLVWCQQAEGASSSWKPPVVNTFPHVLVSRNNCYKCNIFCVITGDKGCCFQRWWSYGLWGCAHDPATAPKLNQLPTAVFH